jgi:hypothetical protein
VKNLKFKVTKASDLDCEFEVEIKTLEELFKFVKECGSAVIIEKDCERLTVYDNWLE